MEGVDRNIGNAAGIIRFAVTLRMEGVDRNFYEMLYDLPTGEVTLRMEGVDRNASNCDLGNPTLCHPPHGGCG